MQLAVLSLQHILDVPQTWSTENENCGGHEMDESIAAERVEMQSGDGRWRGRA